MYCVYSVRINVRWRRRCAGTCTVNSAGSQVWFVFLYCVSQHTHTRLTTLCLGLPGWPGTRKVKSIWILLKQETVSGSGISWAICKSATRCRQIITPAPHHSVFYRPDALPAAQPTASKHWRQLRVATFQQFPAKIQVGFLREAYAVVVVCPSVRPSVCHKPVLYLNK